LLLPAGSVLGCVTRGGSIRLWVRPSFKMVLFTLSEYQNVQIKFPETGMSCLVLQIFLLCFSYSTLPGGGGITFSTCPFVRPSVRHQTCEHDISYKPIFLQIGTSGTKRSTLGVRRSKIKVTVGRRKIWGPGGGITIDPFGSRLYFI